jgi:hypothetical protein
VNVYEKITLFFGIPGNVCISITSKCMKIGISEAKYKTHHGFQEISYLKFFYSIGAYTK